jgi:hypothetical protein
MLTAHQRIAIRLAFPAAEFETDQWNNAVIRVGVWRMSWEPGRLDLPRRSGFVDCSDEAMETWTRLCDILGH